MSNFSIHVLRAEYRVNIIELVRRHCLTPHNIKLIRHVSGRWTGRQSATLAFFLHVDLSTPPKPLLSYCSITAWPDFLLASALSL